MGEQAAPNANRGRELSLALDRPDLSTTVSDSVSAEEAARLLGVHERTVRRAIQRGELIATKQGRSFHITPEELDRYQQDPARRPQRRGQSGTRLRSLPTLFNRFVGRERDLTAVVALLQQTNVRLLTLTGPGGVGKTRLALRVAEEIEDAFADGVAFVALAPVRQADLVIPSIAQALGVREREDQPVDVRLQTYLHNRELLLILDNVEQVTGAGPALNDLLCACPQLTIVVTSRAPLRLSGEQVYAVPPLALPPRSVTVSGAATLPPPDQLAEVEAIQLFVVRAAAAAADFKLTTENAAAVAAICERTEGLPLAIELAAARTRALTPTDMLTRLSPQLPLLTGGPSDQPPRLRSMRNAIAWSFDLLVPAEQALFRRIAVFVSGFTLDAAVWVAGAGSRGSEGEELLQIFPPTPETHHSSPGTFSILDLLASLIDQSLLQRIGGVADDVRFAMLETVREYGAERLAASGEADAVADAHADWCLAFAERADPELSGAQQAIWFERLEAELTNLRAALTWLQQRGDAERGLRLANALSWFWSSRGYLREARNWFAVFLAEPTATTPTARAYALREAGNIAHWQGDDERAVAHYSESLAISRTLGDRYCVGQVLRGLGSIAIDHRDLERAASFLAESGEILRTDWDAAFAIYLAARLAVAAGKNEEAVSHFAEAADAFRAIGNHEYVAAALGQQGAAAIRIGNLATARAAYATSLTIAQEFNEQSWIAWALVGAAHLALAAGEATTAAQLLGAATATREMIGEGPQADDGLVDTVNTARSALGDDRFAAEWQRGTSMPDLQAIAAARAVLAATDDRPPALDRDHLVQRAALTAREREVLRLLVAGLSDKEIARALGITRRTASHYVEVIRGKLGAPSRAAAAALAVQAGLLTS